MFPPWSELWDQSVPRGLTHQKSVLVWTWEFHSVAWEYHVGADKGLDVAFRCRMVFHGEFDPGENSGKTRE